MVLTDIYEYGYYINFLFIEKDIVNENIKSKLLLHILSCCQIACKFASNNRVCTMYIY